MLSGMYGLWMSFFPWNWPPPEISLEGWGGNLEALTLMAGQGMDQTHKRNVHLSSLLCPLPKPSSISYIARVRAPWSSCIPTDAWPSACSPALLPVPSSSESTENQAEKQQTQPLLLTPDPFHCSHGEGERPTCVALWDGPKSACPPVCLKANGVFVKDFCQNNLW